MDRPFGRATLALPIGVATAAGAALLVPALNTPAVAANADTASSTMPLITDAAAASRREAAASTSSRSSARAALPVSDKDSDGDQFDLPMTDPLTMATAVAELQDAQLQDTADAAAEDAKAQKKAKAEKEAAAKEEAEAKAQEKPEIIGTRYTTTALNVRTSPDGSARVVTTLDPAEKVRITDTNTGDWQQIMYDGQARWVDEDFLSRSKPSQSSGSDSGSSLSSGNCTNGTSVQGGTGPNGHKVHRAVCARFPSITTYGGNRGGGGNHGNGRGLDIMVSGPLGWDIANFLRANAKSLGVSEVIYEQKIWTVQRSSEGWRGMSNRGSATANHYDHVHVSTY